MNEISIASLITALIFISFSYKVNANDIENSSAIPVTHSIPTSITPSTTVIRAKLLSMN